MPQSDTQQNTTISYYRMHYNSIQHDPKKCKTIPYNTIKNNTRYYTIRHDNAIKYNIIPYSTMQYNRWKMKQCDVLKYSTM